MKINNNLFNKKIFENLENLNCFFDYLKISIASPKRIKYLAEKKLPNGNLIGELLNSNTLDFKTNLPINGGLFCQKIFGPIQNYKCACGKYNGLIFKKICEICNVELINSKVRKYRIGYINLNYPITHIWYLKNNPSYITLLLKLYDINISISDIENIIYSNHKKKINFENKLNELNLLKKNNIIFFGNEILKLALENINIKIEIKKLRSLLKNFYIRNNYNNKLIIQQIRILESFYITKTNPSWIILTKLPILPANLRPFLVLENNKIVSTDINEIYKIIINRNLNLINNKKLLNLPLLIKNQEKISLQECIDILIDNRNLREIKQFYINNNKLKSLTELLEGKYGRFRQYLLGKRVDFSARSIITVDPKLKLNQCGIPYDILFTLFNSFLLKELNTFNSIIKIKNSFFKIIKKNKPFIWNLISKLSKKYFILLNRAPTLHKFGIQAFESFITLDKSIHLHPLVCTGYNADFDGDQMAIYLPIYKSSQLETKYMMKSSFNLISYANNSIILKPTQEIILGYFYLTLMFNKNFFIDKKIFNTENDALSFFYQKKITLHTSILINYSNNSYYKFKILNKKLYIYNNKLKILFNIKKIKFLKIYKNNKNNYFVISNIGILNLILLKKKYYILKNLILETTPGRLLFINNFNKLK
jgi:DNA-directed RNA polymerase subunit beta'